MMHARLIAVKDRLGDGICYWGRREGGIWAWVLLFVSWMSDGRYNGEDITEGFLIVRVRWNDVD